MNDEKQIFTEAEALASRGLWKETAPVLEELHKISSLSMEAITKLANYYSRAGDYDSAIIIYERLAQEQPSEAKWYYYLGFQYQQKGNWPDAITSYKKSFDLAPRWTLVASRLGDAYQEVEESEKALEVYRNGITSYLGLPSNRREEIKFIYAKLCTKTARAILDGQNCSPNEIEEAVRLFQESVTVEPNDADNWYRLGCALLEVNRLDEALNHLQKAETLNPKKEYICHKIAQVYLKKGDPNQALSAYGRVPVHRRVPYILHGMGQCHMAKGEAMEAAKKFYQATQREPGKFYHHWDFALALITLGAREQAIEALEQTNPLFRKEYGKDYRKALEKFEEVKLTLAPGNRISFDEPSATVGVIRFGTVAKYNVERGFGFIKDNTDGNRIFFYITRVKGRIVPQVGTRTKDVCEVGEKGLQAAKVWLLEDKQSFRIPAHFHQFSSCSIRHPNPGSRPSWVSPGGPIDIEDKLKILLNRMSIFQIPHFVFLSPSQ